MSSLDAFVLAAGSLGLAVNLAISQPKSSDSVGAGPGGMTPAAAEKDATRNVPLSSQAGHTRHAKP